MAASAAAWRECVKRYKASNGERPAVEFNVILPTPHLLPSDTGALLPPRGGSSVAGVHTPPR